VIDEHRAAHLARVRQLREAFASANERLVARLRNATDEAAERHVGNGWTAAQIGWHVATVSTRFAAMIAGDLSGPQPLPPEFQERAWSQIAAAIPERLQAPAAVHPPPAVRRTDAVAALEASGLKMAHAFDALTLERGAGMGVTNAIVGTISVYQLAEWAAAHIARHNKQAKRVLGEG
jgi:DinB superfamily